MTGELGARKRAQAHWDGTLDLHVCTSFTFTLGQEPRLVGVGHPVCGEETGGGRCGAETTASMFASACVSAQEH